MAEKRINTQEKVTELEAKIAELENKLESAKELIKTAKEEQEHTAEALRGLMQLYTRKTIGLKESLRTFNRYIDLEFKED